MTRRSSAICLQMNVNTCQLHMKRQLKNCWSSENSWRIREALQRWGTLVMLNAATVAYRGNGRSFALVLIATWLCWTCLTMSSGKHGFWPIDSGEGISRCVFSQTSHTMLQRVTPYQPYHITLCYTTFNSVLSWFILRWLAFLSSFRIQQPEGTHSFPFLTSFTSLRMSLRELHCFIVDSGLRSMQISLLKFTLLKAWRGCCSKWRALFSMVAFMVVFMRTYAHYCLNGNLDITSKMFLSRICCLCITVMQRVTSTLEQCSCWYSFSAITSSYTGVHY